MLTFNGMADFPLSLLGGLVVKAGEAIQLGCVLRGAVSEYGFVVVNNPRRPVTGPAGQ